MYKKKLLKAVSTTKFILGVSVRSEIFRFFKEETYVYVFYFSSCNIKLLKSNHSGNINKKAVTK